MDKHVEEFKEKYKDYKTNWKRLNWFQRFLISLHLFLANMIRADIHRCPHCGKLTYAIEDGVTPFGWRFISKCHRCNHVFTWSEMI